MKRDSKHDYYSSVGIVEDKRIWLSDMWSWTMDVNLQEIAFSIDFRGIQECFCDGFRFMRDFCLLWLMDSLWKLIRNSLYLLRFLRRCLVVSELTHFREAYCGQCGRFYSYQLQNSLTSWAFVYIRFFKFIIQKIINRIILVRVWEWRKIDIYISGKLLSKQSACVSSSFSKWKSVKSSSRTLSKGLMEKTKREIRNQFK